jgi:hypothetical protein
MYMLNHGEDKGAVASFLNQRGEGRVKTLAWLLALSLLAYFAYLLLPMSVSYIMLRTDIGNEVKVAHMYSDEALTMRIIEKAGQWSVDLEEGDILISRGASEISIKVGYEEEINVFGVYKKPVRWTIEATGPLKEGARILQ